MATCAALFCILTNLNHVTLAAGIDDILMNEKQHIKQAPEFGHTIKIITSLPRIEQVAFSYLKLPICFIQFLL